MKQYNNRYNAYIRINPITDLANELSLHQEGTLLFNNYDQEVSSLFKNYGKYEKTQKYNYKKESKYQSRYGNSFEILLPEDLDGSHFNEVNTIALETIWKDRNVQVPIISSIIQRGKGRFLYISVLLREIYDTPRVVSKRVAKKDVYKDSVTKQYCEPDNPNAVKVNNKGDILSSKESLYSNKVRWFSFKNNEFEVFKDTILNNLIHFYETHNVVIEHSYFTKRFDYHCYDATKQPMVRNANRFIQYLDSNVQLLEENMLLLPEGTREKSRTYKDLCNYISNQLYFNLKNILDMEVKSLPVYETQVNHFLQVNRPIILNRLEVAEANIFENFSHSFG